jgi:hypothetical protein
VQFNTELDEMAREVKYGGLENASWRFNRVQIGRLVDNLPLELPGRETIITRLWTIISDVERSVLQNRIKAGFQAIDASLKAGDPKKCAKVIENLDELLKEAPDPAARKRLEEFRAGLLQLGEKGTQTKQLAAYQKLLDKADKLAFQQEWKKSIKGYQECQFWLSRNDVPNKNMLARDVQQKLEKAQAASTG